jgi:putative Mg2+ transporter-C (MgtC) family protein
MMLFAAVSPYDAHIQQWAANLGWPGEAFLRLALAIVAGGLVGLERELHGRQAGFRTNLLVCLGSALAMIVSISFATQKWPHQEGYNVNIDPARIAYGVMTGIGFLGAGTIVQAKGSVRGLTTAAALWCVSAVGLAAGLGLYSITAVASVLVLLSLWILNIFEDQLPKVRYRNLVIRRLWKPGCIADTIDRLKKSGLNVLDATFDRTQDLQSVDITLVIAFTHREVYDNLERQLEVDHDYILMASHDE